MKTSSFSAELARKERLTKVIGSLMKRQGKFVHLGSYTVTRKQRQELMKQITDTFQMMGVKYETVTTVEIRVLTQDQIDARTTFSMRHGYKPCPIDYSITSQP